jgi:hypothetical protein
MEDWMSYETMLHAVFQQPPAYPYPAGSCSLGALEDMTDEELRRLPVPRLRDQAFAVEVVFGQYVGRYMELKMLLEQGGMTPYLDKRITEVCHTLLRLQREQRRLRPLLDAVRQPRWDVERN